MKKKIIAILCAIAMLIPMAVMPASAWTTYGWTAKSVPSDIDYSFAVIGDMQTWAFMDTDEEAIKQINEKYGKNFTATYTNKGLFSSVFDWIIDQKDKRKIEYVFGLGDTIERLSTFPTGTEAPNKQDYYADIRNPLEWSYASEQFARLNGKVPYLVARGNHDDDAGYETHITTAAYKADKNFFCEETNTPSNVYGNSLGNSYQKIEIGGQKYLMMSLDFNISDAAIKWANDVISSNSEYRVIIVVHAYLNSDGSFMSVPNFAHVGADDQTDGDAYHDYIEFRGEKLWNEIFRKHENVFATLSGHVVTDMPYVGNTKRTGDHGNQVLDIVVDPSRYVTDANDENLVMMLNFREDTNEIEIEYLSPSRAMSTNSDKNSTYHVSNFYNNVTTHVKYKDIVDWKSVTRDLGLHTYVGAPMNNGPTLDGTVNEREYSYKKYYAPDDIPAYSESETQSGITEYIAHDADYVYYAASFTQEANDRAFQLQFNPLNTFGIFNDKTNLKTTLFQRVNWQIRYQADGSVTVSAPTWNYDMSGTLPVVGTDLQYKVTKTEDNVKTYEIKLSKDYLAEYNNCSKEDIKVIPYMTICHKLTYISHNYTQAEVDTLKSYGATRAELGAAPAFMVLEEATDAIQNTIKPATKNGASVRISTENAGLRFKTSILKSELDALVEKYGEENVSVGTLIAPLDILKAKGLTVADNKCDAFTYENTHLTFKTDYVAVVVPQTKDGEYVGFRNNAFSVGTLSNDDDTVYYTFAGSLSNIKLQNLGREFVGRGYISYVDFNGETHYIYSDTVCVRSIDYVANAAMKDTTKDYSMEAYAILEKLTVKYYEDLVKDPFGTDPF